MSIDDKISDEQVSAFVDDQLDASEKDSLFAAVQDRPELLARACDYRQLKDMLKHAYRSSDVETRPDRPGTSGRSWRRNFQAAAAALILGLGGLLGWVAHNQLTGQPEPGRILQLGGAMDPLMEATGVLLHLNSDDPDRMNAALDRAETLLAHYEQSGAATRVELLVNGDGLDLLRSDATPHGRRIQQLRQRYANITFLACNKALERFRLERGQDARLIGEAAIAPSALQQIVTRLQQGWTYVQI